MYCACADLRDALQIVREQALQRIECAEPEHPELAHVADVEDARGLPYSLVLVDDAGVLHRHLPSRERHHSSPQGEMLLVQRGALQLIGHGCSRPSFSVLPRNGGTRRISKIRSAGRAWITSVSTTYD